MAAKLFNRLTNRLTGNDTIDQIVKNSDRFNDDNPFPIESVRVKRLIKRFPGKKHLIAKFAEGAYPVVHEDVLVLMKDFLEFKREHGSNIEKSLYKDMTIPEFVDRLISKRPLVFVGTRDYYVLRDRPGSKSGDFESIGLDGKENYPLILKDYLSYDEIKVSALLGTSSHTLAINSGSRHNEGKEGNPNTFTNEGVIVGLVGARFERKGRMERQEIIIKENPEGKFNMATVFAKFYGVNTFPNHQEAVSDSKGQFLKLRGGKGLFNIGIYKKRIRITAETFLFEAEFRASKAERKAYVHVVGLGLGVWREHEDQIQIYADVFGEVLKENAFKNISDIDFSWIPVSNICGVGNGDAINGIKIHISKRNLFDKLSPEDEEKLLVVSWAYDGNSYPGNEFWINQLSASGDPQAACASQVSELHNPEINPWFSSSNLHVVSKKQKTVINFSDLDLY